MRKELCGPLNETLDIFSFLILKYINTKVAHRERLYGVKIIKILAIENLTLGHLATK